MSNDRIAADYDVVVIGGGPAGSTAATLLSRGGLRVAVCERDSFPRFQIGESLLPANLPVFDRLGCHDALRAIGFIVKPGATFYDEYEGRSPSNFKFQANAFQPDFAYNVVRAEFDYMLLRHAERTGATVWRRHQVKRVDMAPDGATLQIQTPDADTREVRARFVVDASGRATVLGRHLARRQPLPDLGKVALFAHYGGGRRTEDAADGNIRIHIMRDGWAWWIPFADGTDSIGFVVHAKVAKERTGTVEALYEQVVATSPLISRGLAGARRLTPVHTAANYAYRVVPACGDRYLTIGDATGFVDPIFSAGVFIAMRSAELAADTVLEAFDRQDFRAARFQAHARQVERGIAPFLALIARFYEPAFLDLFFSPQPPRHLSTPVLWVLSGAAFDHRPLPIRGGLGLFHAIVSLRTGMRWMAGLPVASRRPW